MEQRTRKTRPTRQTEQQQREEEDHQQVDQNIQPLEPIQLPLANPLSGCITEWLRKQDYLIMTNKNDRHRVFHFSCQGVEDITYSPSNAKWQFVNQHRILELDVSSVPALMDDGEWEYYIRKWIPEVRDCTCDLLRFTLTNPKLRKQPILLPQPYFYLLNLAAYPGEEGMRRCKLLHK